MSQDWEQHVVMMKALCRSSSNKEH